jgi:phosphoglucosamine mutase
MVGAVTGKPVEQRMAGSVGGALAAVAQGALIVRVHDGRNRGCPQGLASRTITYNERDTMTRKYFGTDGIRGLVGEAPITPDFVMRLGYAAGKVLASKRSGRPPDRPDRQGHPHLRLHAGSGAGSRLLRRRGRDAGRPDADAGHRLPDPRAAPVGRRGDFGLAQPVPGQRHQVLLGPGHQAAGRGGAGYRSRAGQADGCVPSEKLGRAKRLDDARAATSNSARAPSRTSWTCAA